MVIFFHAIKRLIEKLIITNLVAIYYIFQKVLKLCGKMSILINAIMYLKEK